MIAPTSLAIVLDSFPVERRAAGVGLWGAAAAAAAAIGPTLGGALVELADWRWSSSSTCRSARRSLLAGRGRCRAPRRSATAACPTCRARRCSRSAWRRSTLGIVEGNDWGWALAGDARPPSPPAALLLAGVVARSLRHPRPIVEPALFADRSFRLGNLGTLLFAAAFFSLILGNVLFLTSVWGYTRPAAPASRRCRGRRCRRSSPGPPASLADRFGHRAVIVPGTLVFAAGVLVLRSAGAEPDYARHSGCPARCLTGIGIGLAFPTLGAAAVRDIPADRFATASAVNAAFRQIGAVLGTALLIAIVGEPATLAAALASPTTPTCSPRRGARLRRGRARPAALTPSARVGRGATTPGRPAAIELGLDVGLSHAAMEALESCSAGAASRRN